MNPYRVLADFLVVFHSALMRDVCRGRAGTDPVGRMAGMRWVRNFWFRLLHFLAIAVVVEESLLVAVCPLTDW